MSIPCCTDGRWTAVSHALRRSQHPGPVIAPVVFDDNGYRIGEPVTRRVRVGWGASTETRNSRIEYAIASGDTVTVWLRPGDVPAGTVVRQLRFGRTALRRTGLYVPGKGFTTSECHRRVPLDVELLSRRSG